ncbi:MAG: TIGR03936 family radical SAM-associated protein, partial [Actinobacteria bacterium]|nr:TIGR03936 family radical SAM-associated protein [Actinomycetota bacterium]
PVQRIRIRYTKEGRVRFVSARDLTSVWERALRRADLPIAYSEGFSPHAKVSFPDALPVGYASTGEYAELTFAVPIDPGPDLGRLSATLPGGMDITTYLEVPDGAPKLAKMLGATLWELVLPEADEDAATAQVDRLRDASDELVAATSAEVLRLRPNGEEKPIDVRPALLALRAFLRPADTGGALHPTLRAVLRNDGPTVRPTDLFTALTSRRDPAADRGASPPPSDAPADALPTPRVHRRVAQGEPLDGGLREALSGEVVPLEPARSAEAA